MLLVGEPTVITGSCIRDLFDVTVVGPERLPFPRSTHRNVEVFHCNVGATYETYSRGGGDRVRDGENGCHRD